ncbi:hypothetical protein CAL7716_085130 [Calothrix sp. PCC 7716]|nr:hypothetical protein CAL7716_085130 [Calothrix sp. PCC 7716]
MSLESSKNLFMKAPFTTANPLDFKLRLVWGHETGHKLVAEFSDCRWLPRAGEALVLPIDDADANNRCHDWHWFKVRNLVHDFENQTICAVCKAMEPHLLRNKKPATTSVSVKPKVEKTLPQVFKELEKRGEAIAASTPALTFETHFNETNSKEVVDAELETLRKQLDDM